MAETKCLTKKKNKIKKKKKYRSIDPLNFGPVSGNTTFFLFGLMSSMEFPGHLIDQQIAMDSRKKMLYNKTGTILCYYCFEE